MPRRACPATPHPAVGAEHPLGKPEFIRVWCHESSRATELERLEFCGWPIGFAETDDGSTIQVFFTTGETYVVTLLLTSSKLVSPQGPGDLWASYGVELSTMDEVGRWLTRVMASRAFRNPGALVGALLDGARRKLEPASA